MPEQRSALVTGASGFVGSNLARALVAAGHEVHVLTRLDSDLSVLQPQLDRIKVHVHDGSTAQMVSILESVRPDCVYHLATHFLSAHNAGDIDDLINANVLFGAQLLEAMDAAGVRRLVNAATTWQHYHDRDYEPVNLYAATKQAFEDLLKYYTSARGLHALTLELSDTYGPHDRRKKLFAALHKAAEGKEKLFMSPGEQLLDLLYIDDVTRAFMHAGELLFLDNKAGFEKYQLSAAKRVSLKELVSSYETVSGKKLQVDWGGRSYREREVMNPWNQGKILPGWKPEINLEEGIKRMLAQKQVAN